MAAFFLIRAPIGAVEEILDCSVPLTKLHQLIEAFELRQSSLAQAIGHIDEDVLSAQAGVDGAIGAV